MKRPFYGLIRGETRSLDSGSYGGVMRAIYGLYRLDLGIAQDS